MRLQILKMENLNEQRHYSVKSVSSLYFHIPFCISKCSYCDFTSYAQPEISVASYVRLLLEELRLRSKSLEQSVVPTIYFGGGTPSLLSAAQIDSLIKAVLNHFSVEEEAEITLEANPGTVTLASLEGYLAAGVNRLSLGVQSLNDRQLALLGRKHSADEARAAFSMARTAGFTNIGIDLMNGLPEQTLVDWQDTLREAVALKPEHISVYGLSVEEGTPFAKKAGQGELHLPDEELAIAMLELTGEFLCDAGYEHYEISNFARPGYRSRHNQVYWQRSNYLGFGVGAHSFLKVHGYGGRWENPPTLAEYAAAVSSAKLPEIEALLTRKEAMSEFMFLGLRMIEGADAEEFARQFGLELEEAFPEVTGRLCEKGLLCADKSNLRLTSRGLLLANQVMAEFI
jgi:oxygen-independent coproporphyrinogen-3 oxidase